MKLKVFNKNILYFTFSKQKEMTLTLARPQEYYECDNIKLRGKVFAFEELLDCYTDEDGTVDYFGKVYGFNMPGHVLEDFFSKFSLSRRESKLFKATSRFRKIPYYLIATKEGDDETLDHELVHAHYYLNTAYRQQANMLVKSMRKGLHKQIIKSLKKKKYSDSVITDEINAFMSTSDLKYLRNDLELKVNKKDIIPFVELANSVLRDS